MRQEQSSASELLDIVDPESGEPTGEQLTKAAIHDQGLWHRDVHVWLTTGTHMLQQQRAWDKKIMPGAWDISASGHVGAGEAYLEAARRETEEELGLDFAPERFIPAGRLAVAMAMQPGNWMHRVVGENFVVVAPDLAAEQLQVQTSEVIDVRLYPIDWLAQDILDLQTARNHAPQPLELWQLGIAAMREAIRP